MSAAGTEPCLLAEPAPEPPPAPARGLPPARRVALALVIVWLACGIYVVRPEQQAVVTRFGAVVDPRVYPGIHYALPWPIHSVTKVKVNQMQRLVIGGDAADSVLGRTPPLISQFLTGDQNIIQTRVVVQYFVGVPADFLFRSADVPRVIGAAVESELTRRLARRGVDTVLTTERVAIQDEVLNAAQALLNSYRVGVKLSSINIELAAPPPEAAAAFRDVAGARADAARTIDEAHGYSNDLLPRARGEAAQLMESAEAYRQSRTNQAAGDAARFQDIAAEYAKASEVTGRRLYLEAMEEILPKIKKLIVDPGANLDLSIIGKGNTQAPKQ
jgi:modulator of FtsH protease HflK